MRRTLLASARPLSAALVAVLVLAWSAPPASAEPSPSSPTRSSLARSVDARVASLKPAPRAFQTTAPATGGSDRSFLRSPVGVVAVVAMAAGLALAVKTAFKDNDAVHSPIR